MPSSVILNIKKQQALKSLTSFQSPGRMFQDLLSTSLSSQCSQRSNFVLLMNLLPTLPSRLCSEQLWCLSLLFQTTQIILFFFSLKPPLLVLFEGRAQNKNCFLARKSYCPSRHKGTSEAIIQRVLSSLQDLFLASSPSLCKWQRKIKTKQESFGTAGFGK